MKRLIATMLLLLLLSGCTAQESGAATADLYFENGIIYTADKSDTIVDALAVKDGVIVFAGSAADGNYYQKNADEVIDLEGNMLMPGMIDAHIHTAMPEFFDFDLSSVITLEETEAIISQTVKDNPNNETFFGFGYTSYVFTGDEQLNGPTKERLDELCPDIPMIIYSFDGHTAWLNTKAFEYCGITADTPIPSGGNIPRHETGELWGTLQDAAMIYTHDFPLSPERMATALPKFVSLLNSLGYTSIMTPPGNGITPVPWDSYTDLINDGALTLRVHGMSIITPSQTEDNLKQLKEEMETYNTDYLKLIGAKFFLDGVVDNESALLLEPYTDGSNATPVWEQDALNKAVTAVNRMGLSAHMHTIGDGAVRMGLDAIEYSQKQLGDGDYRNAMTHLQLVSDEDIPRFGQLNVVAAANPYWHCKEPDYWLPVEYAVLGERAEKEYPMKSLLDGGATLTFASDYPVTGLPNPFLAIRAGTTRNLVSAEQVHNIPDITDIDDPTYLLGPDQRLTVTEMLRGYTIDAAYSIRADDITGSLEVGKSADMVIIDRNLFETNLLELDNAEVLATFFAGEMVYSAPEE